MSQISLYLFEAGFPEIVPGLSPDLASSSFPFWGQYTFLDFIRLNFQTLQPSTTLVVESRFRNLVHDISTRSSAELQVTCLEDGLSQLVSLLKADKSPLVLLTPLSSVYLFDSTDLQEMIEQNTQHLIKLSIQGVPVDLYLSNRRRLVDLLESSLYRDQGNKSSIDLLFEDILHPSFDLLEDLPGTILFQNSLMQLYRENLRLAGENISIPSLVSLRAPDKQSVIESSGFIKDSFVGAGAVIGGYVQGSVIFSDCVVRKGAEIIDSVIMNNNRIGAKGHIYKTLIFPYCGDNSRSTSNIGEEVTIGKKRSLSANLDYPRQIRDGLTVLGLSPEIPKGLIIEAGCYIGPNVPAIQLRRLKLLRRGATVI